MPDDIKLWLQKDDVSSYQKGLFSKNIDFVSTAQAAVDRIKLNSEMKDLWMESGDYEAWEKVQTDLIKRLL